MFDKVIIWGHKLHSHTHSYIHNAFYRAFKYMGYDTYWFDNNDIKNINNFEFKKCLFITEGQVDEYIPFNNSNIYILHNCNGEKYKDIKNKYNLQVITKSDLDKYKFNKLNEFAFYHNDLIMMCWGTDLLPHEIDQNIDKVKNNLIESNDELNFIGMPLYPWDEVKLWCDNNNITYQSFGGFNNQNKSIEENMELIQDSIIAPAVQESWQVEHGYIPCRIFKNISYGKMGITNNRFVNDFVFYGKLIYDTDIHKLLDKAIKFNNSLEYKDTLIELMEYVRDNHTYINRINSIIEFLKINIYK
jgi:hypothetical protein